ncbi:hypothetical protein ACNKHW_19610 [Shigella flexneri]
MIGRSVEAGEAPADINLLGEMVKIFALTMRVTTPPLN